MRRDFCLTFDLNRRGTADTVVLDLIKSVRGIHESLTQAAGRLEANRMQLLELELPLLGGRLWRADEVGRRDDDEWIDLVVDRITAYREQAADLRAAVTACVTDEDHLRLARDIEEVRNRLLDTLGLRRTELSAVERELVDNVASVAQVATGVPLVSGLWFGTRRVGRHLADKYRDQPFQQFLYREFVRAWKLSGR